jgi:hypothetical protein
MKRTFYPWWMNENHKILVAWSIFATEDCNQAWYLANRWKSLYSFIPKVGVTEVVE